MDISSQLQPSPLQQTTPPATTQQANTKKPAEQSQNLENTPNTQSDISEAGISLSAASSSTAVAKTKTISSIDSPKQAQEATEKIQAADPSLVLSAQSNDITSTLVDSLI